MSRQVGEFFGRMERIDDSSLYSTETRRQGRDLVLVTALFGEWFECAFVNVSIFSFETLRTTQWRSVEEMSADGGDGFIWTKGGEIIELNDLEIKELETQEPSAQKRAQIQFSTNIRRYMVVCEDVQVSEILRPLSEGSSD